MIEVALIALVLTNLGTLGLLSWLDFNNRKERAKLVNAIISKTPEQFRDLELTEKVRPITPQSKEPDFIPEQDLSDKKFREMIEQEIG